MNLHSNPKLFKEAILATSQSLALREIYVEKDYWVTVALYEIFHSDVADQAVFKGGTALSKCFKLIERFSEDIDVVALRNDGETDNQMKRKIHRIGEVVSNALPEIEIDGLTRKRGNIRKTVHSYNKNYTGAYGQVREHVVLEATWLGNHEPFSMMPICSYITEMMEKAGQSSLIAKYHLAPFEIQVLGKERTFCEKVMSLVRFSKSATPIVDLRNKVRHIYDIHQMLKDGTIAAFFHAPDFEALLQKVGRDDVLSFKNNNQWLSEHPSTAMIFALAPVTWAQLRSEYNGNFRDLVTGDFPAEEEVVFTLQKVARRLQDVEWMVA